MSAFASVVPFRPFDFAREWFGKDFEAVMYLGAQHPKMKELVEALRSLPPLPPPEEWPRPPVKRESRRRN